MRRRLLDIVLLTIVAYLAYALGAWLYQALF